MKNLIALTFAVFALAACPEKAPTAVAEPTPVNPTKEVEKPGAVKKAVADLKAKTPAKTPTKAKTKYTITYPNGWERKPKFMGTDTMALSQPENAGDNFRENVNVVIETVPVAGVKAYYEANLKTMKKMMGGFKIVSSNDIKLASGIKAIDLVYLHKMGEIEAKNRAVFIYEKGSGYVITATAMPTTFAKYNPQFEKIIQSFKVN